jgi:hypothetical protein
MSKFYEIPEEYLDEGHPMARYKLVFPPSQSYPEKNAPLMQPVEPILLDFPDYVEICIGKNRYDLDKEPISPIQKRLGFRDGHKLIGKYDALYYDPILEKHPDRNLQIALMLFSSYEVVRF